MGPGEGQITKDGEITTMGKRWHRNAGGMTGILTTGGGDNVVNQNWTAELDDGMVVLWWQ